MFLVTPINANIEPDWSQYERIVTALYRENKDVEEVGTFLGIRMTDLMLFMNKPPEYGNKSLHIGFYRRFYSAMILFKLTEEAPLTKVGHLMGIPSGQLQQLQKEAATFCGMTVVFCRKLNWNHLASCLEVYTGRLGYGVRDELLDLVRMGSEVIH